MSGITRARESSETTTLKYVIYALLTSGYYELEDPPAKITKDVGMLRGRGFSYHIIDKVGKTK